MMYKIMIRTVADKFMESNARKLLPTPNMHKIMEVIYQYSRLGSDDLSSSDSMK